MNSTLITLSIGLVLSIVVVEVLLIVIDKNWDKIFVDRKQSKRLLRSEK